MAWAKQASQASKMKGKKEKEKEDEGEEEHTVFSVCLWQVKIVSCSSPLIVQFNSNYFILNYFQSTQFLFLLHKPAALGVFSSEIRNEDLKSREQS